MCKRKKTESVQTLHLQKLTQATDWEQIFIKQISDGLVSKICKELLRLNSNKTTQYFKWAKKKKKSGYLTKENIQKANKHMKRCSILYVIRKLQIKTRYYHTLIKWLKSKTITTTSAGKDMEQQQLSSIGGNAKQYFRRQFGNFLGNQACNPWHLPK